MQLCRPLPSCAKVTAKSQPLSEPCVPVSGDGWCRWEPGGRGVRALKQDRTQAVGRGLALFKNTAVGFLRKPDKFTWFGTKSLQVQARTFRFQFYSPVTDHVTSDRSLSLRRSFSLPPRNRLRPKWQFLSSYCSGTL